MYAIRSYYASSGRAWTNTPGGKVSSSLLILCLGVFSGMFADMLASATEQYHGHIVISGEGYQEDRDLYTNFPADGTLLQQIESQPQVVAAAPRVRNNFV